MFYGHGIAVVMLLAFCLTRQPRRLLLRAGLLGSLLGLVGTCAWASHMSRNDCFGMFYWLMGSIVFPTVGCGLGVMVAILIAGPEERRAGASWGLALGGVVAAVHAALVARGAPDPEYLVFSAHIPFLGAVVGAGYSERAAVARRLRPDGAKAFHWQWLAGSVVLLAIVLGPPAWALVQYRRWAGAH